MAGLFASALVIAGAGDPDVRDGPAARASVAVEVDARPLGEGGGGQGCRGLCNSQAEQLEGMKRFVNKIQMNKNMGEM